MPKTPEPSRPTPVSDCSASANPCISGRRQRLPALLQWLCLALAALAAPVATGAEGKIGIIGDSMSAGTHSLDNCGRDDIVRCVEERGGLQDRGWSHSGGEQSWSIASRLGFGPGQVVDASEDGEEWKDALEQAQAVTADSAVNTVFVGLGANDICQKRGHDYAGDLQTIASHIDQTLDLLTRRLSSGSRIFWTGVPDVTRLYEMLKARDHNLLFESCQATWDLDANKVKDGAAADACDHFFDNSLCRLVERQEEAKDLLVELFLESLLSSQKVEEGPCGKLLSSRSTAQDRQEVSEFTESLNQLMADKARLFDGRNGVEVIYSDRVYQASSAILPEHISRFDCYHPSRAGQLFLSDAMWRGFNRGTRQANGLFSEDFAEADYCRMEQAGWRSCWVEQNDDNDPGSGDVRIGDGRLRLRASGTGATRAVPLGEFNRAWLSFNWARRDFEGASEVVLAEVSGDGGRTWSVVDRFQGGANDYGLHRGDYYDISDYAGADTRIRVRASAALGSNDQFLLDNVQVLAWNEQDEDDAGPDIAGDDFARLYGYRERELFVLNNDGPGSSLVSITPPVYGAAYVDGDRVIYKPAQGFEGLDQFSYSAVDGDGVLYQRRVSLALVSNSLEGAITRKFETEPDFAARYRHELTRQVQADPEGEVAGQFQAAIRELVDQDPWFRQKFVAAYRADNARQPVDLYVFLGDDVLQGVTELDNFDVAGRRAFERAMRASTERSVIVMNCAVEGSSAAQWSAVDGPLAPAADYLSPPGRSDLAAGCMAAIDGIVGTGGPAVLRGLVVGVGSNDALLATLQQQPALVETYEQNIRQTLDLFRSRYGAQLPVVLLHPLPPRTTDGALQEAAQSVRERLAGLAAYDIRRVYADDLESWDDGGVLMRLSSLGQARLGERLAAAMTSQPDAGLGPAGDCSPQTPCFPGTSYRIEPALCESANFFRRTHERRQFICDQHGNSLHALAAACAGCIDLESVAADLGVGIVTAVAGEGFLPTSYMPQLMDEAMPGVLPYNDPYTSAHPSGCGRQDVEASTFVIPPGGYDYRVDAFQAERCTSAEPERCGLLLSPQSATRDTFRTSLNVAAGRCYRIDVRRADSR